MLSVFFYSPLRSGFRGYNYEQRDDKGKRIIYVENIKSKHYYLNVRPKNRLLPLRKRKNKNKIGNSNNLEYLIYYYTTYGENLEFQDVDKWITHRPYGRGEIKLDLPLIITNDIDMENKEISDYKFDVFATKSKDYTSKRGVYAI